jgi:hypothetical protein
MYFSRCLLFATLTITSPIVAQEWGFAYSGGMRTGLGITTDKNGNVTTLAYGPTDYYGTQKLQGPADGVVAQHDANGKPNWARGYSGAEAHSLCGDPEGNLYITGYTTDSLGIFYGATTTNTIFTSSEKLRCFLVKYSAAGDLLWTIAFDDSICDYINGLLVKNDHEGNVFLVGIRSWEGSEKIPNYSSYFIMKFDSTGKELWRDYPKLHYDYPFPVDLDIDNAGDAYIAGNLSEAGYFQDTFLTTSHPAIFVARYSSDGKLRWAKTKGTARMYASAISINEIGEIYLAGRSIRPASIDTISLYVNPTYSLQECTFLTRLDSSFNASWVITSENLWITDISIDHEDMLFLAGGFKNEGIFNGIFPQTLTSNKKYDLFAARCNTNGTILWSLTTGGDIGPYTFAHAITCGQKGTVWIAGSISGTTIFNIDTLKLSPMDSFKNDHFIARIGPSLYDVGFNELSDPDANFSIYPSPASDHVIIYSAEAEEKKVEIRLTNLLGQEINTASFNFSPTHNNFRFDIGSQPPGIYFITITSTQGTVTKKFVKQ